MSGGFGPRRTEGVVIHNRNNRVTLRRLRHGILSRDTLRQGQVKAGPRTVMSRSSESCRGESSRVSLALETSHGTTFQRCLPVELPETGNDGHPHKHPIS